jgi:hypothetical protein
VTRRRAVSTRGCGVYTLVNQKTRHAPSWTAFVYHDVVGWVPVLGDFPTLIEAKREIGRRIFTGNTLNQTFDEHVTMMLAGGCPRPGLVDPDGFPITIESIKRRIT